MSDQTDPMERKANGGTDWERIATVLANKVVFAMRNLKARIAAFEAAGYHI